MTNTYENLCGGNNGYNEKRLTMAVSARRNVSLLAKAGGESENDQWLMQKVISQCNGVMACRVSESVAKPESGELKAKMKS